MSVILLTLILCSISVSNILLVISSDSWSLISNWPLASMPRWWKWSVEDHTKAKEHSLIIVRWPAFILKTFICPVFPLKLGNRGKYRVYIQEYRVKVSEHYIKDYCNTSPRNYNCQHLPGADAGLLRGESTVQNCANCTCANIWPCPLSVSHDHTRVEMMALSSEINEVVAISADISCVIA